MTERKEGCGGGDIDRFNPPPVDGANWPKTIRVSLKFEEALKLQIAIVDALLVLNGLNRATAAGQMARVELFIDREKCRFRVRKYTPDE